MKIQNKNSATLSKQKFPKISHKLYKTPNFVPPPQYNVLDKKSISLLILFS